MEQLKENKIMKRQEIPNTMANAHRNTQNVKRKKKKKIERESNNGKSAMVSSFFY